MTWSLSFLGTQLSGNESGPVSKKVACPHSLHSLSHPELFNSVNNVIFTRRARVPQSSFRVAPSRLDLHLKKVYAEPMKRDPSILKMSQSDEERELEFELNYLASLTFEERLQMMKRKSREMLRQMIEHGHRRPFEVFKRT